MPVSEKSFLFALFIAYTICHFGIFLIPNALFWDDWAFFLSRKETIIEIYRMVGVPFGIEPYIYLTLRSLGPLSFRVIVFILMFFTGVLAWGIAKEQKNLGDKTRLAIVLLFLTLPFFSVRTALIHFIYVRSYFLFFLGWFLIGRSRVFSLLSFFLSFFTPSLLVFYSVPIADWFFRDHSRVHPNEVLSWISKRVDYFLLPFIYWTMKLIFYKPSGLYEGYNENMSFRYVLNAVDTSLYDFGLFINGISPSVLCLTFGIAVPSYFWARKIFSQEFPRLPITFLLFGVFALASGVFPYLILGYAPAFHSWSPRFQLLMPLGTALVITWAVSWLPARVRIGALVLVVSASIAFNVRSYVVFYLDWGKQKEVISFFSASDLIKRSKLVVVDDHTGFALGRYINQYEWSGMLRMALKDDSRIGFSRPDWQTYVKGDFDKAIGYEQYNSFHFKREPSLVPTLVEIDYREVNLPLIQRVLKTFKEEGLYSFKAREAPHEF